MIRMSKKGVEHTKLVANAYVGIRRVPELGLCVCVRLDEFEVMFSLDRASILAAKIFSKIRVIKKKVAEESQRELPLPQEVGIISQEAPTAPESVT